MDQMVNFGIMFIINIINMGKGYENIYSDIKNAKDEKNMESAIEEMSDEDVSMAIEDEVEAYGKAEVELMISRLDLGENESKKEKTMEELKELIEYSKEINQITDKYDILLAIEPKGENGREYDDEFEAFYNRIKDNLNEEKDLSDDEYEKMCPTFTYPGKDSINLEEIKNVESKLQELECKAGENLKNENARAIISDLIRLGMSKIKFHEYFAKGESDQTFEQSKIYYGDINDELCKRANEAYADKVEFLKNRPEKSDLEKKLEESEFNAQEIRTYLELALIKTGLKDSGYEVVIDDSVSNIRVSTRTPKYDHGVVLIPPNRKVSGMRMLELCAHEIGRHVTTNYYHEKNGFKGPMGEGWNTVNEGVSIRSEKEIKKEVLGDSFSDYGIDVDYYVLAMEKVRGEKNSEDEYENGWNYAKVFKYIYNLSLEENLCDNGYYKIKDKTESVENEDKKILEERLMKIREKSEKEAINRAKKTCVRVFKGFDPKSGGKYFSKDKIYFEGEVELFDLENAGSIEEFEKYVRLTRVDPKFVPYLIKMGAYAYDKGLKAAKDVAKTIWEDLELPNKEVLQGNKDYELFLPYLNEFMEKYYKDELYNLYDEKEARTE